METPDHQIQSAEISYDFDNMQLIGNFLSFASRGDRVGLNQMLREGISSPNVQDYDRRTALHLAASEGHAPIVELLVLYKANVNLKDRWHRTPLTDARLYGHRDICRVLEVNGGVEFSNDPSITVRHEKDSNEVTIDLSELKLHSPCIDQGKYGVSQKVKWRGTWVVKTVIRRQIQHPVNMILTAKDNTLLRELRHPNILQFLGSIIHGEEMILITEYLPDGNLYDILMRKTGIDLHTALRYALDIARGMNYLHQHKPFPIVHNHLSPRNLLLDEGGHLKIGEYWVPMLYEKIHPNQDSGQRKDKPGKRSSPSFDTMRDIRSFGLILFLFSMLEGRQDFLNSIFDPIGEIPDEFQPKFHNSRCPLRIQELIERCTSKNPVEEPSFTSAIQILEEVLEDVTACVC